MRRFILPSIFLIATSLSAQTTTLNLGDLLATSKNIILLGTDNSNQELKAVDFSKGYGSTFGKTFFIKLDPTFPKFNPTSIHFGDNNPTRGTNMCFVRLVKKDGDLKGEMKKGFSGNSTHPDFAPYSGKKGPDPVKQADGKYITTLTEPLAPGYYAIASDSKAWVFEVIP